MVPNKMGHAPGSNGCMPAPRKRRSLVYVALFLLLGACARQPMQAPDTIAVDHRIKNLEGRVESLERRDTIAPYPPLRSREEIEAHIQSLESDRVRLLASYHVAHPDVRYVDRRLQLLKKQLEMLD